MSSSRGTLFRSTVHQVGSKILFSHSFTFFWMSPRDFLIRIFLFRSASSRYSLISPGAPSIGRIPFFSASISGFRSFGAVFFLFFPAGSSFCRAEVSSPASPDNSVGTVDTEISSLKEEKSSAGEETPVRNSVPDSLPAPGGTPLRERQKAPAPIAAATINSLMICFFFFTEISFFIRCIIMQSFPVCPERQAFEGYILKW